MQVERNSVWLIAEIDGVESGNYRILEHFANYGLLVLFRLDDGKGLVRPISLECSAFIEAAKLGNIKISSFPTPSYQVVFEDEISPVNRERRDKSFELVRDLINRPDYLLDLIENTRSRIIAKQARILGVYPQKIYRSLNLFWRYGQEINALLPAFDQCGGGGEIRSPGRVKRGAPVRLSTPGMVAPKGVNTKEDDRANFVKGMKKYGLNGKRVPLTRVYDQTLKEFFADELRLAESENREPAVPSFRSFRYWIKRLIPEAELIRKQTSAGDFARNKRGLRGSATDITEVPGSCFELDATVLDVHIVSEFNRQHVLGRPTVYLVVDKESRMIVGLHVSMEYASWRAGRQALVNSFTSKQAYCRRFGIEIEEAEWPCCHIPQRLMCDRGEFICSKPEEIVVPLIGHLSIAPPYRAELKGIVEHRFQILNEKLVHELMGTTNGRNYIRGDRDPRLDATLTLTEVTKLLIDQVLEHNSSLFDRLAGQSLLLVESGLAPTPLNYWNIHLKRHCHSLNKANEAEVRARLLPVEQVSMTSMGLRLNENMYYECDRPEFDDWKVIARSQGRWQLEARVDQDNASYIYVRLCPGEGFTRCSLMPRSSSFTSRHRADVLYFEDWKKLEKERVKPSGKSIERHNRRQNITNNAIGELKKEPSLRSSAERTKGMKERRKEAITEARISSSESNSVDFPGSSASVDKNVFDKTLEVVSLLKRRKRADSET